MAKKTQAAAVTGAPQAWVKEEITVALEDTGDSLEVLRRVYQKYANKACELYLKSAGGGDEDEIAKKARIRKTAAFYKTQAENIQALLNQ